MNEFYIGERVRFRPGAQVSPAVLACEAIVKGYEVDILVDTIKEDFLVVSVKLPGGGRCEQWVNPREVEPVKHRPPERGGRNNEVLGPSEPMVLTDGVRWRLPALGGEDELPETLPEVTELGVFGMQFNDFEDQLDEDVSA